MDSNNGFNNEIIVEKVPKNQMNDTNGQTIHSNNGLECEPKDNQMNDNRSEESITSRKSSYEQSVDEKSIEEVSDGNEGQADGKGGSLCGDGSRHQYSKEQLIAISKLYLARIRPKCLDKMFNNPTNGLWDPEKWMASKSGTVITSNKKYDYIKREESFGKKANNDLKERVIEEENDIILSPQRGSFGTGCHVSATTSALSKAGSDSRNHFNDKMKGNEESGDGTHRQNMNHRRVGTGRIVAKDRDRPNDWMDRSFDRDRNYEHRNDNRMDGRNDGRSDGRENRDNRIDDYNNDRRNRRFFDRRTNNYSSNRNNRFDNENRYQNRYTREEEDEPEWFTEGPTSKHETIELKGFDDDSEHRKSPSNKRDGKGSVEDKAMDRRNSREDSFNENQNKSFSKKDFEPNVKEDKNESKKAEDFDVNELFKTDDWFGSNGYEAHQNKLISSMDGISDKAVNQSEANGKSRSKRWFKESPMNPTNPMTAQFSDNSHKSENVLKELNSCQKENRAVATASSSRALSGAVSHPSNAFPTDSNERHIFDLLKGSSNRLSMDQMSHHKLDPTKALNLSEIEDNLKPNVNQMEEKSDKRAFEKLITELGRKSGHNAGPVPQYFVPFTAHQPTGHSSERKSEATILQTQSSNLVIPKTQHQMMSAPTILELLKEEENKERMEAMDSRNMRRFMQGSAGPARSDNHSHYYVVHNPALTSHAVNNSMNPMFTPSQNSMTGQDWQNTSPLMKTVRPKNPSVQEVNDHTNYLFQNALLKRQQMDGGVKTQMNEAVARTHSAHNTHTPNKGMSNSNFFTPTSVIRKMHSMDSKDKDLVNKSVPAFDEMTTESTSSQKFLNEQLILKPNMAQNSPRAIIKSNNPMAPNMSSMAPNKPVLQSPLSPQSDSMSFSSSSEPFTQSQQLLYFQQQHQQQQQPHCGPSQPVIKSHQRPVNSPNPMTNPNMRAMHQAPMNLPQNSLGSGSTPSPNANNNMQTMLQMLNQSNVRPNQSSVSSLQMNQLMAFQHLQQMPLQSQQMPTSDSRQSQYSQSRPITASIQNFLHNKGSNSEQFRNSSFDRNLMSESEHSKQSMATTYTHPRPQQSPMFMNSGHSNLATDSRFLGQLFNNEVLNHTISDMPPLPPVPHQNALTLDDIERP